MTAMISRSGCGLDLPSLEIGDHFRGLLVQVVQRLAFIARRIRNADAAQRADARGQRGRVQLLREQPRIARHDRAGRSRAGIVQMIVMPGVGILAADALQIRPDAFGTPQERMVIDEFARLGIFAVALGFRAERADHLRMAGQAAFPDVNVAARAIPAACKV